MDIVGTDANNHASSLLLRNGNEGFAFINNSTSDRLELKSFNATADAFTVHSTGSNVSNLTTILTLAKTGAITFNSAYTFPTADGSANQVLKTNGSGVLSFADDSGGGGSSTSIVDTDGDTKIQVEESADEDIIRFDVAGNEFATFKQTSSEHYFRLFRRGTAAVAEIPLILTFVPSATKVILSSSTLIVVPDLESPSPASTAPAPEN